jgi:hypothetical protein
MGKGRERQIILKTDERKLVLELGAREEIRRQLKQLMTGVDGNGPKHSAMKS